MNEILEFVRLEAQLSLVLSQISSIIQRGLTIAQNNAVDGIVQVLKRQEAFVGVVGVQAGQHGRHELYDVHLGLNLVEAVECGDFARHRHHTTQNRRVSVRFGQALETFVDFIDQRRQHDFAAKKCQILEGFFSIGLIRFTEYGREYDTFHRIDKLRYVFVAYLMLFFNISMVPLGFFSFFSIFIE
jgi:hypothetical protein